MRQQCTKFKLSVELYKRELFSSMPLASHHSCLFDYSCDWLYPGICLIEGDSSLPLRLWNDEGKEDLNKSGICLFFSSTCSFARVYFQWDSKMIWSNQCKSLCVLSYFSLSQTYFGLAYIEQEWFKLTWNKRLLTYISVHAGVCSNLTKPVQMYVYRPLLRETDIS